MLAVRSAGAALALGGQTRMLAAAVTRCAPRAARCFHSAVTTRAEQDGDKKNGDNGAADEANKAGLKSAEELSQDLSEVAEALKKAQELVEKEKAKADDFKDKYVRALAEAENVRKRSKVEIENQKNFAIQKFAKSLLQVSDVFELAVDSVPKTELENEQNNSLRQLHSGVLMIRDELHKVFKQFGVEKMEPFGAKFDPNAHEALFEMMDPSKEPGTVAVVQKSGYTLNGRTLRAAVVGVVKDPNA